MTAASFRNRSCCPSVHWCGSVSGMAAGAPRRSLQSSNKLVHRSSFHPVIASKHRAP